MNKITTIEKDCFYIWLEKPADTNLHPIISEIVVGDSVSGILKTTGIIKFKKFFEKDLKKDRSIAYRYEKRFKKENGSRWFIISQVELTKNKIAGCKSFEPINIITHRDIYNQSGRNPIRKVHYYYIVNF